MKCDFCSCENAVRYEVEYGWVQEQKLYQTTQTVTETTYRPIGVLTRDVCTACGEESLKQREKWTRLGWWLGALISVPLGILTFWVESAFGEGWAMIPALPAFGFMLWWLWSILYLLFWRLWNREDAVKEAIHFRIWLSSVEKLREDLKQIEPHFVFHPNWDRSSRNIHSNLGPWHYASEGGYIYKYSVEARDLGPSAFIY